MYLNIAHYFVDEPRTLKSGQISLVSCFWDNRLRLRSQVSGVPSAVLDALWSGLL
jgi:hypothetical protein